MADLVGGLGLLEKFSLIFPFLLVWVLTYAILGTTKIVGDNKGLHAIAALALAMLTLFSDAARQIINLMAPWFVIFFIFLIFMLMAVRIFGDVNFLEFISHSDSGKSVMYWIVAIGLIIFLGSISSVAFSKGGPTDVVLGEGASSSSSQGSVEQGSSVTSQGSQSTVASTGRGAFWNTITHPNVLGLAVILLIGMFTIQRLASYS